MRKKIDSRIRTLIENGVRLRHRSLFVVVGDRARDQVVNLHYLLSKSRVQARPSVLWCYKKELDFSGKLKKKLASAKRRQQQSGGAASSAAVDTEHENPFDLFVTSTNIRYCYYKDSHKVLGNTYGMLVLQDFRALTPNILARTIETVEGGGLVVILLHSMSSLKQLYSLSMDVHARFQTEAHNDVVARFNERFILSLADNKQCLVVDDELNILPLSSHSRQIKPIALKSEDGEVEVKKSAQDAELDKLKLSVQDTEVAGPLIGATRTLDQARALLTFVDAISEKTLRSTVTLTAARGRGKSASLGLAIAAAVAFGYSNVFVTSPSPENLKTLFEFVFKGFDQLGYEEHRDYSIVESVSDKLPKGTIVRVNIFHTHRQTIQYLDPRDHNKLGQAELVVIDEAAGGGVGGPLTDRAAIPLPLVRSMLGNYLVFLSTTINGYEGTGRALSLKLFQQLRNQAKTDVGGGASASTGNAAVDAAADVAGGAGRQLKEVTLSDPIRYGVGDSVEAWLHALLCLDAQVAPIVSLPHPKDCELYFVNRDALFSYHDAAEAFLQKVLALYVSSHYKNSPNDLQLLSDAPAHCIFALMPRVTPEMTTLPDVLCVVQVAIEGEISKQTVTANLNRGERASGDLIPWLVAQQFQDPGFASLNGGRVVRIATHPSLSRMGYGTRALQLLVDYYEQKIVSIDEPDGAAAAGARSKSGKSSSSSAAATATLLTEELVPRTDLPPLLQRLETRRAEALHYLGTSFGLTEPLFHFWRKSGFRPVYVRQTTNDLTGEHTSVMLRPLANDALDQGQWLPPLVFDFTRRFSSLLAGPFREFPTTMSLEVLRRAAEDVKPAPLDKAALDRLLLPYDLKRLESYEKNLVDYHVILDLVPTLARVFFSGQIDVQLQVVQQAVLCAMGMQMLTLDDVAAALSMHASQCLAIFNKAVIRLTQALRSIVEEHVARDLPAAHKGTAAVSEQFKPLATSLDADLTASATRAMDEITRKRDELLKDAELRQYAIHGKEEAFAAAASKSGAAPSMISVATPKSAKRASSSSGGGSNTTPAVASAKKHHKHH